MDINPFITGFAVGKKNAKKPVLTELTVTENGVYDQPVIGGEVNIAVGETVTFKESPSVDDIPAEYFDIFSNDEVALYGDDNYTWNITANPNVSSALVIIAFPKSQEAATRGAFMYANEEGLPGVAAFGVTEVGWSRIDTQTMSVEKLDVPPSITIENADTLTVLTDFKNFFEAPSTPADGWNKVTVNVPGDIVDVPELPTENIEEGKIYRVTNGDIVTYGIPNASPVKRLVDGAWVELT